MFLISFLTTNSPPAYPPGAVYDDPSGSAPPGGAGRGGSAENPRCHKDGNGRTGRMILFRESIKCNLLPIIIQDADKLVYYTSLKKAQTEQDYNALASSVREEQGKAYIQYKDYLTEDLMEPFLSSMPS